MTTATAGAQLLLDLLPPPHPGFDNFIAGANGEALATLRAWLAAGDAPTCFVLWGERHSGRRHLLAASGWTLVDAGPAAAAQIDASASAADLAVANVDRLDADGQAALFKAFNHRRIDGGRLLASSLQPPAALAVREDLRTRLASGLVYRLAPLADADKAAALAARAQALGLDLPAPCIDYLFRHAPRDLGSLIALVDALDRFTLREQRAVTLPVLKTLLAQLPDPTP